MQQKHLKTSAFSLVELSIVLVIIGLLVGGVLSGKSLIRAAQLRSVPVEYEQHKSAVLMFQEQYNAKPGDMSNATRIWGNAQTGGTGGTCTAAALLTAYSDGKQTCNGNGDGTVQNNEGFRFWQHLANAGLVDGRYTGIQGSGGSVHWQIGKNCPASRIAGGGWSLLNSSTGAADLWSFLDVAGQVAYLGGQDATNITRIPLFLTKELWGIDQKMDDGKPGSGAIRTRDWQNCSTGADRNAFESADYALNYTGRCTVIFFGMY